MIDHIGLPVSEYERAKAFYAKALALRSMFLYLKARPGSPARR